MTTVKMPWGDQNWKGCCRAQEVTCVSVPGGEGQRLVMQVSEDNMARALREKLTLAHPHIKLDAKNEIPNINM